MQLAALRSTETNPTSSDANRLNDKSLVLAAKVERATAFATLSGQYREQLFRAAHRITRIREDAEDAVQDTLLRAFVHLDAFEGRSNFGTWLTSITVNSALMILRKKRASRETAMGLNNDPGGDDLCYGIADHAPNPETRYAQIEEQRILKAAIQRLRPNLRIVVQILLQGLSMREAADVLGISLSAAKARLFHAKKALRKSAIGRLANQPRFVGNLTVSRPELPGTACTRTQFRLRSDRVKEKKETSMSSKSKQHQNLESHATSAPQGEAVHISETDSSRLEEIRIRAYEIYMERGGQPGHELEDWLQAERELEPKTRSANAGQ